MKHIKLFEQFINEKNVQESELKNFADKNAATSLDYSDARSNFFALYSDGDIIDISRDIDKGLHQINNRTTLDDMQKIYSDKDNKFRHLLAFYYKKSDALAARKKYKIDYDETY